MSNRLENIYTHLVQNRKHQLNGWHNEYKRIVNDIQKIKVNLENGKTLRDDSSYLVTSFKNFDAFIQELLYEKSNGVSSRGQSVLSWENLGKFKSAPNFDTIISNIIKSPSLTTYIDLQNFWRDQNVGFNPVLINRVLAACNTDVSTTVDEDKFNQVFYWLQREKLIDDYPNTSNQDWYSKNLFVIQQFNAQLNNIANIDPYWIGLFCWEILVNLSNPFSLKKQIVKYGAPGTGKTYTAKQTSQLQFNIWKSEFAEQEDIDFNDLVETIQFHPSYTYEDFMEGLRPILDSNKQAQLSLENGIFKSFCIVAGKWEVDVALLNLEKDWTTITIQDLEDYKKELNNDYWKYIFDYKDKTKKLADAVPPYFMIIDEINRAELSRVFGELMLCLEYRGIKGAVKTQYAQLNNNDTGMIKLGSGFQFFIPHNVYILATMNTIDRSVESFDFALRRRFKWEEVEPDISLLKYHFSKKNKVWTVLADNLGSLNEEIAKQPLLGKDYRIGHAYLWDLPYSINQSASEIRRIVWKDSIAPLLEEYLRGTGREDLVDNTFSKKFGL
ncbi:McrB family protein [Flavobacterium sp. SLB02]|uniref:McrB family protein n=1 Tax=Flavobacterium sp. SLB02 TaxID=2665645 RepID=UPI0012A80A14|nr:AAA family ATPase [Flavobacterium sp. SLB02]QGK73191.1 AAA domain-containing protein [Flavobacterium sp. SLB02]